MSDIEPALTPEEWAAKWITIQAKGYDSARNGAAEIKWGENGFYLTEHEHDRYGVFDEPRMLHKVAAIALHGQPFGFTREDVALIRMESEAIRDAQSDEYRNQEAIDRAAKLASLADRIESLLPPEE